MGLDKVCNHGRRSILAVLTASVVAAFASAGTEVLAQEYPERAVRVINPYSPGGSTDPVLRPLAQKLHEFTGQNFYIENKPGAGTNIGSELVAKAKPDGYTLLLGTSSLAISPSLYKNLNYDPAKDLEPVALLVNAPFTLAVSASLPVNSVQELLAYAKAHPGKLNYGSSGNGGAIHLGMELFKSMTGTDIVHIPYKGSGESVASLLAGDIHVLLSPSTNFAAHAKSGRLRMLAVAASRRVEGLDLPTVAESGVPGFESGVWMALFAPAGTPPAIVTRLNVEVNKALRDPSIAEAYTRQGMLVGGGSPQDIDRIFRADLQRWPGLLKASGAKID
jgi:tripartite-type tricarboxylate transporter receptor subunit TctC